MGVIFLMTHVMTSTIPHKNLTHTSIFIFDVSRVRIYNN